MTYNIGMEDNPSVSIIMGSKSDWVVMRIASEVLQDFEVAHECKVISAHRTPERLIAFAGTAENRGIKVIIAGAGGAAHLPGMAAAISHLPVLGVPVKGKAFEGMDSLLSIVQMPKGVAVSTFAVGEAGAYNAALAAVQILSLQDNELKEKFRDFRCKQTEKAPDTLE